jgi:hypothetical protein
LATSSRPQAASSRSRRQRSARGEAADRDRHAVHERHRRVGLDAAQQVLVIAETDPAAAHHAPTMTVDRAMIEWAVLASDGAADLIEHAGHRL